MELKTKLLKAVREICSPNISIVPIKRCKQLMIIKYPHEDVYLDDWAVLRVHPLHWGKIYPLIEKEEKVGCFRFLYCCGNKFVLYVPDLGINVLGGVRFGVCYDVYGYENRRKYVGECADIEKLVSFLTENTPKGF